MDTKKLLEQASEKTKVDTSIPTTGFMMPIDSILKVLGKYTLCAKFKKAVLEHYKYEIGNRVRVLFQKKTDPSVEAIPYDTEIRKIGSSCGIIFDANFIRNNELEKNMELKIYLMPLPDEGEEDGEGRSR